MQDVIRQPLIQQIEKQSITWKGEGSVDAWNLANQLIWHPIIYKVLCIPGGAGSFSSTVWTPKNGYYISSPTSPKNTFGSRFGNLGKLFREMGLSSRMGIHRHSHDGSMGGSEANMPTDPMGFGLMLALFFWRLKIRSFRNCLWVTRLFHKKMVNICNM